MIKLIMESPKIYIIYKTNNYDEKFNPILLRNSYRTVSKL